MAVREEVASVMKKYLPHRSVSVFPIPLRRRFVPNDAWLCVGTDVPHMVFGVTDVANTRNYKPPLMWRIPAIIRSH